MHGGRREQHNMQSDAVCYGVCDHLVHEDVCSFLLSQRSFTTDLFATYFNGGRKNNRVAIFVLHMCSVLMLLLQRAK